MIGRIIGSTKLISDAKTPDYRRTCILGEYNNTE